MVHPAFRSSRLRQRELAMQPLVMCLEQSAPEHVPSLEALLVSCRMTLFTGYPFKDGKTISRQVGVQTAL